MDEAPNSRSAKIIIGRNEKEFFWEGLINRRVLTDEESSVLYSIWGPYLWRVFPQTVLVDDTLNRAHIETMVREFGFSPPTDAAHFGTVGVFAAEPGNKKAFIFAPKWAGIAVLAHEIGHAIAWATYGDEVFGWSELKNEAFAMLADVNVSKRLLPTSEHRQQFACHIYLCRHHPLYRAALRQAYKIRQRPLFEQMVRIAEWNG